jgi:uncharacterized protein
MKVVLDTNILIQSVISSQGRANQILNILRRGEFEFIVSEAVLQEYSTVLTYPRIQALTKKTDSYITEFIQDLRDFATIVHPKMTLTIVENDPTDNKFFECAVAGRADYIVSSNKHLLDIGEYRRVRVVTPEFFRDLFE